jgi:hemerythrin-like domain-containing protein
MNFFTLLKQEHKEAKGLFKELLKADVVDREKAELLCHKLQLHMEMEEKCLYPILDKISSTSDMAEEAELEHAEAKKFIRALLKGNALDDIEYKVKLEMLHVGIEHHVQEEESEFFPEAEKILSKEQVQEITDNMLALKEKKAATIA